MSRRLETSRKKYKGVRRRKSGKYVCLIWDPFKKRTIWLGTFGNAKEASETYVCKKREFEEEIKAKQEMGSEEVHDDEVLEESVSVSMGSSSSDSAEETEEDDRDEESEFGVLFGVRVIDRYGFLLGEFSKLDDLRFREDDAWLVPHDCCRLVVDRFI